MFSDYRTQFSKVGYPKKSLGLKCKKKPSPEGFFEMTVFKQILRIHEALE